MRLLHVSCLLHAENVLQICDCNFGGSSMAARWCWCGDLPWILARAMRVVVVFRAESVHEGVGGGVAGDGPDSGDGAHWSCQ